MHACQQLGLRRLFGRYLIFETDNQFFVCIDLGFLKRVQRVRGGGGGGGGGGGECRRTGGRVLALCLPCAIIVFKKV